MIILITTDKEKIVDVDSTMIHIHDIQTGVTRFLEGKIMANENSIWNQRWILTIIKLRRVRKLIYIFDIWTP